MSEKELIIHKFARIKETIPLVIESMCSVDGSERLADDTILYDMKEDMLDVLSFTKIYIIAENDKFTSYFFSNMEFVIDFQCPALSVIKMKPVFYFIVNPLMIENYTFQEFAYEVKAQIMGVVFNHPALTKRIGDGSSESLERLLTANKVQINEIMYNEELQLYVNKKTGHEKLVKPRDYYTYRTLEILTTAECTPKATNFYYKSIIDQKIKSDKKIVDVKRAYSINDLPGIRYPWTGTGKGFETANISYKSAAFGNSIKTPDNVREGDQGPLERQNNYGNDNLTEDEMKEAIRNQVDNTFKNMTTRERALMSGSYLEQIDFILNKKTLDWQKVFQRMVGTIPENHRRSPLRLNRRQPFNPMLRGTLNDKVVDIIIAIDTSGSMTPDEIVWVLNEIRGMLRNRRTKITIIECDYKIQKIYDLEGENSVKEIVGISGRGGTSFGPVIKYINNKAYREQINELVSYKSDRNPKDSLLIYFTDGEGEISIQRPNVHRAMWVLTREVDCLSISNTHGGIVVSLLDDARFKSIFNKY